MKKHVLDNADGPVVITERLECQRKRAIEQFTRAFATLSLVDEFNRADAIFIKPNLTYPSFKRGVTTRVEFVDILVEALREINDSTKIYIGEGEGGYNSFSMTNAMEVMGYFEIAKRFSNVKVVNLTDLASKTIHVEAKGKPYTVELPRIFFDDIDFSISCPLPKVHCMTKVTLALKNQWGCLPDTMRLKNHYVFHEIIGQVCEKLKFRYAFLDGQYGLDSNGPMAGIPVEVNWFAASNSLGAFDMIVSEMMGFHWKDIRHLKHAAAHQLLSCREDIAVKGDMEALRHKFVLKRDLWNYVALSAFNSKPLTHLFYFSRWTKLLHDIMYTFRKRPIEE